MDSCVVTLEANLSSPSAEKSPNFLIRQIKRNKSIINSESKSEVPKRSLYRSQKISRSNTRYKRTNAGIPSNLQPSIICRFPCRFDVINTTSAPHDWYASLISFITSGRPPTTKWCMQQSMQNNLSIIPRFLESHSVMRSGPKFRLMRDDMVGPNVFSWSEPIQIRYLDESLSTYEQ